MFATFTSSMDARSKSAGGASHSQAPPRQKRSVATRACDRCRTNRIKCDDNQPCKHCRVRGLDCYKGQPDRDTTERSDADVETLRNRVTELQAQLQRRHRERDGDGDGDGDRDGDRERERERERERPATLPSPPDSVECGMVHHHHATDRQSRRHWQGVWKPDLHTGQSQRQYYGPTAFAFFVHRMGSHLESGRNQPQLSEALQASASLDQALRPTTSGGPHQMDEPLTRRQEEGLLNLFWQSYHSIFPILDEDELRNHYNSLWPMSLSSPAEHARRPSALVDIILALCMQYSTAAIASGTFMGHGELAILGYQGRSLYDRCQTRLRAELGQPSPSTLQCHIYSAIYLVNASSFTRAHAALSAAAHIAHALGIHHEPPDCIPDSRPSLRRRLWWSLFHLDTLLGLALGRPYVIHASDSTLDAPESDLQMTANGSATATQHEDITWVSYHAQSVKLMIAIRAISASLSAKCNQIMATNTTSSIYSNSMQLETCASLLRQNVCSLQNWVNEVPPPLRLRRKDNREPFSAGRCQVEFDTFAPLWLQRQRVLLELLYHNMLQGLYRTFIHFPSTDGGSESLGPTITTTSDGNAVSALNHAMATINIIHQTLTETDLLNSWHRAYQYQWEATVVVIGFTLARPLCPFIVSARKAINVAIQSLDMFASHGIVAAATAARITRELNNTTVSLMGSLGSTSASPSQAQNATSLGQQRARRTSVMTTPQQLQSPFSPEASLQQRPFSQANNPMNTMMLFEADEAMSMDMSADVLNFDVHNMAGWDADLGAWSGEMGQS